MVASIGLSWRTNDQKCEGGEAINEEVVTASRTTTLRRLVLMIPATRANYIWGSRDNTILLDRFSSSLPQNPRLANRFRRSSLYVADTFLVLCPFPASTTRSLWLRIRMDTAPDLFCWCTVGASRQPARQVHCITGGAANALLPRTILWTH